MLKSTAHAFGRIVDNLAETGRDLPQFTVALEIGIVDAPCDCDRLRGCFLRQICADRTKSVHPHRSRSPGVRIDSFAGWRRGRLGDGHNWQQKCCEYCLCFHGFSFFSLGFTNNIARRYIWLRPRPSGFTERHDCCGTSCRFPWRIARDSLPLHEIVESRQQNQRQESGTDNTTDDNGRQGTLNLCA